MYKLKIGDKVLIEDSFSGYKGKIGIIDSIVHNDVFVVIDDIFIDCFDILDLFPILV
jgi:hypothetical protein